MVEGPTLDLDFVRAQFPPLANGWAYFENAGGSYVPSTVIDRIATHMRESQMQPAWPAAPSRLANEHLTNGQRRLAEMIHAEPDEVIVGPSTTLNVYVLSHALRPLFEVGDEIVVTNQDHEANGGAWRRLEEHGMVIREWRVDPESGDLDPADLGPLLTDRTRLVCFPHCSNIVGSLNPVAEITARAHDTGAMVCVDGVAYAAHGGIDVKAWDVDFYLFSLYKLYGPHLGVLYGKRDRIAAAHNQNHFFHDGNPPETLHPGGLSYESVAGIQGVADYLDAVYRHHFEDCGEDFPARASRVFELFTRQEEMLATRFVDYLSSKSKARLIGRATGDRSRRLPTFSFTVEGCRSRDVVAALSERQIVIGHGHFYGHRVVEALGVPDLDDGVVRVSMVHYNTLEEVDRLAAALEDVIGPD